jgi:hypothetical protein
MALSFVKIRDFTHFAVIRNIAAWSTAWYSAFTDAIREVAILVSIFFFSFSELILHCSPNKRDEAVF